MLLRFKKQWLRLWHSRPGRRFQNHYRRAHRLPHSDEMVPRIGRLLMGFVFFVVGVCLVIFPLIYIPFFVLSGAMLASESERFARILDQGEASSRGYWAYSQQKFGSRAVKAAAWAVTLGCLVLTGRACYHTFLR